jgi:[ribosomal protein S5]-alanine N-acetyltransferase
LPMELKTNNLRLRELRKDDLSQMMKIVSDPQIMRYLLWFIEGEKDVAGFIDVSMKEAAKGERGEPRGDYVFSVEEASTDRFIGNCALTPIMEGHGETTDRMAKPTTAEVGYWLKQEFWGKGYATEITKRLIALGFEELKLHRVFAVCDDLNVASRKVLEKSGMKYEGTTREHVWLRDHWRSSRYYGILEGEYSRHPKADRPSRLPDILR